MIVSNERYDLVLYKRKPNSHEWEDKPSCYFKGRPANQIEVKRYRIQQGVEGNTDSTYVFASNLPINIKPKDKIVFMGKEWTVESIGYYFESSRFVNPSLMNEEYIASKCPKGISIQ